MKTDRADIVVYTLGWEIDQPAESVERATAQVKCRVTLNGVELDAVLGIEAKTEHGDFLEARIKFGPSSLRFVSLLADEWSADELPVA